MTDRKYDRRYKIGEVAKLIAEPQHVIRFWDAEFRIRPLRSKSGQRVFSQAQVDKLYRIRELLREDLYTIEGARRVLARESAA